MRKLDIGEAFEVIEGPKTDEVRSLTRVKARTKNDGKEGWVTLKGNQGKAYAEESDKHYICKLAVPLERTPHSVPIRLTWGAGASVKSLEACLQVGKLRGLFGGHLCQTLGLALARPLPRTNKIRTSRRCGAEVVWE